MMNKKKVILSLSGGADSTTMLAWYISNGYTAEAVFFDYGSKQNNAELNATHAIAKYFAISLKVINVRTIFHDMTSTMMASDTRDIPLHGYDKETMSQTVVPGRNTIFASILAGIAESKSIEILALGVHGGDHYLYPDCRPEYITSLKKTLELSSEKKVTVETPFLTKNKTEIIALGLKLAVPYELTRSCYAAADTACGRCGTCVERLEAFNQNGVKDPIRYLNIA